VAGRREGVPRYFLSVKRKFMLNSNLTFSKSFLTFFLKSKEAFLLYLDFRLRIKTLIIPRV